MKVAVIQSEWIENIEEALERAYRAVRDIAQYGHVDFVCFPEFFLGPPWYMPGQGELKGVTDTVIPGPITDEFCELARSVGTHIVLGSLVENMTDGMYRNSSLLINPTGHIAGNAVKAHAFGNEMVLCCQADSLETFDTGLGRIGVAVCSDFWIPEVIRVFALAHARIIFVPGGTLIQNQSLMVNALSTAAYMNGVYLVYASSVGRVQGRRGERKVEVRFAGTSLVADPNGTVIARAGSDGTQTLLVDLDLERLNDCDARSWIAQRRPQAYQPLLDPYVGIRRDLTAELQMNIGAPSMSDTREVPEMGGRRKK
ncbi:hypothetical protein HMPREF1531_00832 [Propionibacterium sp. oral taxon 192 str. F0372]|uniref:carbon-nitrogen hydrolase family protein n=1 Tax=Propionibacterium sp. oral taxon 192 TaxID=671222 RepID=UPI000353E7B1|nr:carbon-nitrogen hydrolase family protein [Propionibacterium sp. oral taxon 192]EPH06183.1 hypothetical protein HMPREF1531_00832 [Propionibacterium sp. oral taxon 192 str. F0372]